MLRAIVLHPRDNVAVLLDTGAGAAVCKLQGAQDGQVQLTMPIPCGHKLAVRAMKKGDDVIKYGEVVGRTTATINIGEHVHVHNVESLRGRGDLVKKGP
jgi:altronate dehydratase small subunit